jgi:hypothetical protein
MNFSLKKPKSIVKISLEIGREMLSARPIAMMKNNINL